MSSQVTIDPRYHDAVLFDLDGVVTDTAAVHAVAWQQMFDDYLARRPAREGEDHSPFTDADYRSYVDGKPRHDGVHDFLRSRGIELPSGDADDTGEDTVRGLGNRKQQLFLKLLDDGVPAFPTTVTAVRSLQRVGIATAVFSASRNCERVLQAAGLGDLFPVRVDGVVAEELGLPGKPDPAVLIEAARRVGARPERSVIVEDAVAGVQAGRVGGFALVIGVDRTGHSDELFAGGADVVVRDLEQVYIYNNNKRMSDVPDALECYGELIGVVAERRLVAFADFDGTLSEIVDDPETATMVDGADEAMRHLAALCPGAILSGRELADIRSRVGIDGIWYAGSHGFEISAPDGSYHCNEAASAAVPLLERAADELGDRLGEIPGIRLERKRFAVAVHYRKADRDAVSTVLAETHRVARDIGLRLSHGRKLVELVPDVDWNKGTTVSWICDQIDGSGWLLPLYVGDDLTDEDAFEAVRLDGIAIAVHHDEAGDRPTAAQFSLDGPAEVCEFMRRGGNWVAYRQQASEEAWTWTYEGYEPHDEKLREALCTVGNGHFASRGAAPESRAGQVHYPGTYAAGVFNRLDDMVSGSRTSNESMVNLPNWLPLTFRIDGGDWFDVDHVELLHFRQTLDLRGAVLTRDLRFRDKAGRTTSVTQHRFAAMDQPHVAALETTIVAENWSGTVEFRSLLDGDVGNFGVDRYRELASNHLTALTKRELTEDSVLLRVVTNQSQIPIAMAARTTVWRGDNPVSAKYRLVDEEFAIGHEIFVELAEGESLTAEKVVTLVTGRDVATSEPAEGAERRLGRQGRFAALRRTHELAWSHLWRRLSVEFEGHTDELRILRLHMLHLMQTVSQYTADLDVGVPARGLHGEAYRGHIFWDELFIFPVLNLRMPAVTRSLLQYRYRRLLEARRAARLAGYAGAMFPWQSGSDGREESPNLHLNPRSGRWNPDPSQLAHHIGIAVAYNVWQFYQVTGDLAYLIDYGTEMLVEVARFWVSRTSYDAERDRYCIRGVIGPDEFHDGYPDRPYEGVDNNAYTNVMAVWVILRAIDALNLLPLPNRLDIRSKLGLTNDELVKWDEVSRRMFVPFHDGIISQFEGYGELAELDWDGYRKRYGNIQRLDRILEAENDDVNCYQASKQADALMLLYLLSSDELRGLLDRMDYYFPSGQIPKMVDYYMARTSHGSTLSAVVHAWVLARANRDRAVDFFHHVLVSDVTDIQGGTTSEGIHLAAMAGSVDLVQRCFTGLETRADRIVLSPNWPEALGGLGFPMHYRGHHMYLRVSGKGAEITVAPRDLPPFEVECRGRVQKIYPGTTTRFT